MKHWKRLRNWLIKKLARNTPVMINITVSNTFRLPHGEALFHNVEIAYPKIAIFDHDVRQGTIITHPEGTFITVRDEEEE